MKYGLGRALLWIATYLAVTLVPLAVAYRGPARARGFWVELAVGLGFLGFAVMAWQFVLTGRFRHFAASFGLDSMLQYHKRIGILGVALVLAHPLVLFLADGESLAYLDPRANFVRALALWSVLGALVLIIVSSQWRTALGLSYEWWRVVHGFLATFILFVGVVHILQVGYYVSAPWQQATVVVMAGAAVLLLVNTRLIRPLRMRRRPYRVQEVRKERSDAWTLSLAPVGHAGMRFRSGQFTWLTLDETPFSLQQHPYSFSSSAQASPERVELTIKAEGDFSSAIDHDAVGRTAYLEGPYGYFVPDSDPHRGCVMIAGGVGITPCMSMLRTFADLEDRRDLLLIYCNVSISEVIFLDALEEIQERVGLTVVHVLEEPPEGWEGETGLLDRDIVERNMPRDRGGYEYMICGPAPMMDIAETSLLELGVPQASILSERFNIV